MTNANQANKKKNQKQKQKTNFLVLHISSGYNFQQSYNVAKQNFGIIREL